MKKNNTHPLTATNTEALYAQIDKKNKKSPLQEEVTYAELNLQPAQKSFVRTEKETIYTEVASRGSLSPLTEEQIADRVKNTHLVKTYTEQIARLSQTVYGREDIFQSKMHDIIRNPNLGDEFSWQLAAYPKSVGRIAGINFCGFKNDRRKEAETAFVSLCAAIDGFTGAVQYEREKLLPSPFIRQEHHKQEIQSARLQEVLHHPQKERMSPTDEDIISMVQSNGSIRRYHKQVEYWCGMTFGNPNLLKEELANILKNPEQSTELLSKLENNPKSVHKLAGINFCGIKNKTRIQAENSLSHLCVALETYISAITEVRESFMHNHLAQPQKPNTFSKHHTQETVKNLQQTDEKALSTLQKTQPRKATGKEVFFAM
ncbi:BID domain-containing T4SS effector [Bartonella doshiae]|uniref:BID domain-containing T4SS effector n=1 Tax=Bartonella doshiae TaxID=33044 RepID=UPI001ABBA8E4|nr:BID domain-containing T4SS effector [Bartonella doshiae]